MSDEAPSAGSEPAKGRRFARFRGILKNRRGKQVPMLLVLIVVLAIAMIYSLVTGMV
jgi:hypothetical protein